MINVLVKRVVLICLFAFLPLNIAWANQINSEYERSSSLPPVSAIKSLSANNEDGVLVIWAYIAGKWVKILAPVPG